MKAELYAAADFVSKLMKNNSSNLGISEITAFRESLIYIMYTHYHDHWFPDFPCKGSGYRCIRINLQMDPLIAAAGLRCGYDKNFLRSCFPTDITMWIDPHEVSYRIGENGSICVLYDGRNNSISADGNGIAPNTSNDCPESCKGSSSIFSQQSQWYDQLGPCVFS